MTTAGRPAQRAAQYMKLAPTQEPTVPAAMMPQVHIALAAGFQLAFLACAVVMAVAVVIALGMRDLPLRSAAAEDRQPQPRDGGIFTGLGEAGEGRHPAAAAMHRGPL